MQAATLFSHTPADHTLFHEICTMQTLSSQLHNAGDFVLHEEHIEGMTTISSEVLPSATHPGLSCNGATKIFIPVTPESIRPHTWLAAELQKEMSLWLATKSHNIPCKVQSMILGDKGLTA